MSTFKKIIDEMIEHGITKSNVHRISWKSTYYPNTYVTVDLIKKDMTEDDNCDDGGSRNFFLTLEDVLADDWEEYDGKMHYRDCYIC